MARWHFRSKMPGEPTREPVYGEFFASDAISAPGNALVREGIQNALDAAISDDPVIIRIYLSGQDKAVPAKDASKFFKTAWKHFLAQNNGLHPDKIPDPNSPCRFLAFEDFTTSGLTGDTFAHSHPAAGKNHFYHFFRAEGQSDKEASHRGSWGVGKHVFFRASQISTVFGYTVRSGDNRSLLMGKSVLKSHYVDDSYDMSFQDGYFGIPPENEHDLVFPVENNPLIGQFSSLFSLQRSPGDPGLSLVVLWPDQEITDKDIVSAVLRDYFYPILSKQLEVLVETPTVTTVLDAKELEAEVAKLDKQLSENLKPLIDLAVWARDQTNDEYLTVASLNNGKECTWSKEMFTEEQLAYLRKTYHAGDKLVVRVPVILHRSNGENENSFFNIYLFRDSTESLGRPTFIREGIIVSEVKSPKTRGTRSLVTISDRPLAEFLRSAENPSHTEWHHARLKHEYKAYKKTLDFVKRSVHELVRILSEVEKEEDRFLLADFFPLPPQLEQDDDTVIVKKPKGRDGKGEQSPKPDPDIPRSQKRFRVKKIKGGFSVVPTSNDASPPKRLDIRIAYDVRRGNPLKKYNPADFKLNDDNSAGRLNFERRNVHVIMCDSNHIVLDIKDSDFAFSVSGFDERRQLYVKALPREVTDGDKTV
jgi:hypothetical protein